MAFAATTRVFRKWFAQQRGAGRVLPVAGGFVVAVAAVFALGEFYLRVSPPGDLSPYITDSHRPGPFRDDPKYGVQYRSMEALLADNAEQFGRYLPVMSSPNPQPLWAFFGSSGVNAPGALADTTREFVPQRLTFNLKTEPLPVRLAQAEFLLNNGMKPDRIFFAVVPVDVSFAKHGLDQYRATDGGALCYAPRVPPVGGSLIRHSRLALKSWTRTTMHQNLPFAASGRADNLHPAVRADIRTVFAHFAEAAARHSVPVTVILIPNDAQILRGASFALQDAMGEDLRGLGYDVCDVREPFLAWPNKPGLFIPDMHFNVTGNRLLLAAILSHLKQVDPRAGELPSPAEVRP